jgi:hypothetical protein
VDSIFSAPNPLLLAQVSLRDTVSSSGQQKKFYTKGMFANREAEQYCDWADYFAELYLNEAPLCLLGVAPVPKSRSVLPRVIGANGSMLKLLQQKHECRIRYIRALGGFVVSAGSQRKIDAARRDIEAIAAAAESVVTAVLPFDIRLIRGAGAGERLWMVQQSFGVNIRFRPLEPLQDAKETAAAHLQRCMRRPLSVEATVTGRCGGVQRTMAYYEKLDLSMQREMRRRH